MGLEKQIYGVVALGNVSGATAVDASKGNYFLCTLVGDTVFAVSNVKPGHAVSIEAAQDIVAGHVVTWTGGQVVLGATGDLAANGSTPTLFQLVGRSAGMTSIEMLPRQPAATVPHTSNAVSQNLTASPQNEIWILFGAAATPKLPDAASNLGSFCTVSLENVAAGVTVGVTTPGDLINGSATYAISGNWHSATFLAYTSPVTGIPVWRGYPGLS
jgi:hypothetical protein